MWRSVFVICRQGVSMIVLRLHRGWVLPGLLILSLLAIAPAELSAAAGSDAAAENGTEEAHDDHTGAPIGWDRDLVLWSIITFVLFLTVLKKLAWGPLISGLDDRESKYRKLLADAQQDRDKAVALLAGYDEKLKSAQSEVDEIIAEARRDAERTKTDIVATANNEAEATRKRALDDIERAKDQAISEMFDHVRSNVVAATENILGRSLNDEDHQRMVDEALAEVSGS